MFAKLASLAVASCLFAGAVGQQTLEYHIPTNEALALSQVVDDNEPAFSAQKGAAKFIVKFPLIFQSPAPKSNYPSNKPNSKVLQLITFTLKLMLTSPGLLEPPVTGKDIRY